MSISNKIIFENAISELTSCQEASQIKLQIKTNLIGVLINTFGNKSPKTIRFWRLIFWLLFKLEFNHLNKAARTHSSVSVFSFWEHWKRFWFRLQDLMAFLLTSQLSRLRCLTSWLFSCLLLFFRTKNTFHYDMSPVFSNLNSREKNKTVGTRVLQRTSRFQRWPTEGAARAHLIWSSGSSGASELLLPFSAWKGEATGRRWDVLNALIIVTASATSSLMWSRHLESVAHAARKGWRADWETASFENLQIAGPTSVSSLFLRGVKRLENDILSFIKCLYYYIKPVQVL